MNHSEHNLSISNFVKEMSSLVKEYASQGLRRQQMYTKTVASIWNNSQVCIERKHSAQFNSIIKILNGASYLGAKPIPVGIFGDDFNIEVKFVLKKYYLATFLWGDADFYVQDIFKHLLISVQGSQENSLADFFFQFTYWFKNVMKGARRYLNFQPINEWFCEEIQCQESEKFTKGMSDAFNSVLAAKYDSKLEHAEYLIAQMDSRPHVKQKHLKEYVDLLWHMNKAYQKGKNFQKAVEKLMLMSKCETSLPSMECNSTILSEEIGDMLYELKHYEQAGCAYGKAFVPVQLSVEKLDYEQSKLARKIGDVKYKLNDFAAALKYLTAALPQIREFDGKSKEYRQNLVLLGYTYYHLKQWKESTDNLEVAYPLWKEKARFEIDLIGMHRKMGTAYYKQGNWGKSIEYNKKVFQTDFEQNAQHVDALESALQLMRASVNVDAWKDAVFFHKTAQDILLVQLPNVLNICNNIVSHFFFDFHLCMEFDRQFLRARSIIHAYAAAVTVPTIVPWYNLSGDEDGNELAYYEEMLLKMQTILWPIHFEVARFHYIHGQALEKMGNYKFAMVQFEKAHSVITDLKIGEAPLRLINQQNLNKARSAIQQLNVKQRNLNR